MISRSAIHPGLATLPASLLIEAPAGAREVTDERHEVGVVINGVEI